MKQPINTVQFIAAKRNGQEHTEGDLRRFIAATESGSVADYQLSAWLMAAYLQGLNERETAELTAALTESGFVYPLDHFSPNSVDKHSTGGVGDKTTLVVVPVCATAGAVVPKMSGRGLGFTGGTLDKLEAIPGFRSALSPAEFEAVVGRVGAAIAAQSAQLVPADGRLYALRDVTATVDSTPLIAASVMSKKLALGCPSIVLDIKVGSGAFMPDVDAALELARAMISIGQAHGRRVTALLSAMEAPLGRAIGNALEVEEALDALRGGGPADFVKHCLLVSAEMLHLSGTAPTSEAARAAVEKALRDGSALAKLAEMVQAQGGDPSALEPGRLPRAGEERTLVATRSGYLAQAHARAIGEASIALGAGRRLKSDAIDLGAGVLMRLGIGDTVRTGDPIATAYSSSVDRLDRAWPGIERAFVIADEPPAAQNPVLGAIRS